MNLETPILADGDRQVLDRYDGFEDPETPTEFQNYCGALARMILAGARENSYRMGNVQRIMGIGNAVERGEVALDDGKAALDDADVGVRKGVPDPEALKGDN